MGIRGEIFSTRVLLQNRTYFFNVKENRMGDLYLNIVESKNRDTGGFERQSVILFAEDLQDFLKGFDYSLRVLEKAIRERKRSGYRRAGEDYDENRGDRGTRGRPAYREDPGGDKHGEVRDRHTGGGDSEYHGKYRDESPPGEIPARKPRRLVAKKRDN